MRNKQIEQNSIVRNLVFGIQDSFGSTVGFLSGVAVSNLNKETLLFTGILLILVEAFSMSLGSLLSEHTVDEMNQKKKLPLLTSIAGPITMFFAYAITGLIPLAPYYFFWGEFSLYLSIGISIIATILIGYISAKMFKIVIIHHIKETLLITVIAIIVGLLIGQFAP